MRFRGSSIQRHQATEEAHRLVLAPCSEWVQRECPSCMVRGLPAWERVLTGLLWFLYLMFKSPDLSTFGALNLDSMKRLGSEFHVWVLRILLLYIFLECFKTNLK